MSHAAQLGAATAFHIDHGAHGGTGTGQATEQAGHSVADTLTYKLTV